MKAMGEERETGEVRKTKIMTVWFRRTYGENWNYGKTTLLKGTAADSVYITYL